MHTKFMHLSIEQRASIISAALCNHPLYGDKFANSSLPERAEDIAHAMDESALTAIKMLRDLTKKESTLIFNPFGYKIQMDIDTNPWLTLNEAKNIICALMGMESLT